MADKNVESGFPVDGGADDKIAYLAKQDSATDLKSIQVEQQLPSLKIQVDSSGRQLAAGFSYRLV